ncbi:MAG: hypothetical protein ABJP45_07965 [Cyclobacteriaceae bacterium]
MKAIVFLTLVFFGHILSAQDVIVMKNGDELNARVEEVGTSAIKYKKFENLDGPTYSVNKNSVFMIRYENGSKDVFNEATQPTPASPPPTTSASPSESEMPQSSFNVNPLGFLQFGPIFQYESKIGPTTYIVPYFRYAFAGVATHLVWTAFEEDSELSAGTAAIGVGVKSFASSGDSWYYGGILDLGWATARYDLSQIDATEEKATSLGIVSNFGYRWRSDHGTYVNVGLLAGASFDLKDEERFILTGELYSDNSSVGIFGMLELSFGWEIKK